MPGPDLHFRPYEPADLAACLSLFVSNCPPFFHPSEQADFEAFLQDEDDRGEYTVLERGGEVVACGGIFFKDESEAGLSWGMVHQRLHGQGLGTLLTCFRLDALRARQGVRTVWIDTSQHTEGFYAREGFVAVQRTPDGFAPGLDEIKMKLDLTCAP